ncbi:hypothetical protein LCGC14_1262530 [marine sediment metagenome]|uniref:Uncharacterized protein n=1 Tax=marine sediment metagenome TaxID=412755 RepID=A0A0F9L075_9ZZZZ
MSERSCDNCGHMKKGRCPYLPWPNACGSHFCNVGQSSRKLIAIVCPHYYEERGVMCGSPCPQYVPDTAEPCPTCQIAQKVIHDKPDCNCKFISEITELYIGG